jgi:hypothetical protein
LSNTTCFSEFDAKNPDDWVTASEAARIRGVTRQAIANLMGRGKLRTLVFGQKTFVNRRDVETYVPDPGGRPKKKSKVMKKKSAKRRKSRNS